MSFDKGIEPGFIDDLLALRTREQQTELLRENGLLDADGLDLLLDEADRALDNDLDSARQLARICIACADDAEAPAASPRAHYVLAGAHGINGDFEEDLRLTRAAHDGYAALGMTLEALRTKVGLMPALLELGRYEEALAAGQVVLDALGEANETGAAPKTQESERLVAFVYQNRGACFELVGRYDAALEAYDFSKERYQALGMIEHLGQVEDNRGIVLSYLGRGREALAAHETAAGIFEEEGLTLSLAKALANVGETYLQLADFVRSLGAFEKSRRLLRDLDATAEECSLLHNTATAYLNLALYQEALATYQEANDLLRRTGMVHDLARTLWGMGSALMALSEHEEAGKALDEAATLFEKAGNAPLLSSVLLEQASLHVACGNTEQALSTARRALHLVSGGDRPIHLIYAHLSLADLLPGAVEAEPHLLEARRLADPLGLPQLFYRLDERLGCLRLSQGRRDEAKVLLEAAVGEIERLRGTVTQETMRVSFLQNRSAAYTGLLQLHLDRDDGTGTKQAFAISERAKSRALVDLLTGVAERGTTSTQDSEVEERLGGLQADLNATYNRILGGAEQGTNASLQDLQERANQLETSIGRLRLQAAAASSDPFAAPAAALGNVLERHSFDGTLLAYHTIGDEILAFVVSGADVRVARNVGSISAVRELSHKLALQWARLLAGSTFAERHMTMLERSTRQVLAELYGEVMAPLDPLLEYPASGAEVAEGVPKLTVVPYGHLHRVPFHALFDGERYVLETFEVSYAPSATVYALCQERQEPDRDGAAIFGAEDPSIPTAAAEARAVAKRLVNARVRVGEDATVEALRHEASEHGVLHLACHGLFRAGNPMFSSLKLHDGWLTAADALNLDLPGSLVTLSACESGRSGVTEGDEVLGLTRAFLGAGAATLVVSLWLVQDETTAVLMEDWYGRMGEGMGQATALRAAQLAAKERHPHPYYWAPFVLIGRR